MKTPEEKQAARRARNLRYRERVERGIIPPPPSKAPEERRAEDYVHRDSGAAHRPATEPRRSGGSGGGNGRILGIGFIRQPGAPAGTPAFEFIGGSGQYLPAEGYEAFLDRKQRERETPPEQSCTVVTPRATYSYLASERRDLQRVADLVLDDLDLPASRRNDVIKTLSTIPEGRMFQFEEEA